MHRTGRPGVACPHLVAMLVEPTGDFLQSGSGFKDLDLGDVVYGPRGVSNSSSTPRNPNLLLMNKLRACNMGVAPGAVVGGRVCSHGYGASICCTVGGSATPVAANTLPQVPWASLRNKNRLPSCSTSAKGRKGREDEKRRTKRGQRMRRDKTGLEMGMKESYREDLASYSGLETYAGDGNIAGVASSRGNAGQPLSSEIITFACRSCSDLEKAISSPPIFGGRWRLHPPKQRQW